MDFLHRPWLAIHAALVSVLGMFREKEIRDHFEFSMTRVVAFMFAVVYLNVLSELVRRGVQIGWPMATLGFAVLVAVPVQVAFQKWGKQLTLALLGRFGVGDTGQNASAGAVEAVEKSIREAIRARRRNGDGYEETP